MWGTTLASRSGQSMTAARRSLKASPAPFTRRFQALTHPGKGRSHPRNLSHGISCGALAKARHSARRISLWAPAKLGAGLSS
jgi:hypothetical protein